MIVLLAVAEVGDTAVSNPLSEYFYDLAPILMGVALAAAAAFRKRIGAWAEGRSTEKDQALAETVAAAISEAQAERDAALVEVLQSIHDRLPPSAADVQAALEVVQQGVAAGLIDVDEDA